MSANTNVFNNRVPGPDYEASSRAEKVVLNLVRARHGRNAVVQRPISHRINILVPSPADYAAGIAAARTIAGYVHRLMCGYVAKARSEGRSWRKLAEPLGSLQTRMAASTWQPPRSRPSPRNPGGGSTHGRFSGAVVRAASWSPTAVCTGIHRTTSSAMP